MVGFVAGLPFLYQMVDRKRQIEVPKYLRPRTDTPKLTVGHGGCFGCIYSVRGAGGYQMFGITPMPIYDPKQEISYLRDFMVLLPARRHREMEADRPRRPTMRPSQDVEAGKFAAADARRDVLARRVQQGHRRLQPQARGGAPWPLRSSLPASPPRSRISAGRAITTSAFRSRAAWTALRFGAANLLVGNDEGRGRPRGGLHGAGARVHRDATVAVTGAELPPKVNGETQRSAGPRSRSRKARCCRSTS